MDTTAPSTRGVWSSMKDASFFFLSYSLNRTLTMSPGWRISCGFLNSSGSLGTAAATPVTLERLVALIADPDSDVRQAAARAPGRDRAEISVAATSLRHKALT